MHICSGNEKPSLTFPPFSKFELANELLPAMAKLTKPNLQPAPCHVMQEPTELY